MDCRYCGAPLAQGATACPECGSRQRRRASSIRCARCHHRVPVDLVVCPRCGRDLKAAGPPWLAWLAGVCVIGVAGFWGLDRMPVRQTLDQVMLARDKVVAIAQMPILPQMALTPMSTVLATGTAPSGAPATATVKSLDAPSTATTTPTTAASPIASTPTALPAPTESTTPTPSATPEPAATEEPSYVVRAGDTLLVIGQRTGMAWQEIARLNGLTERSILSLGQRLRLPAPTPVPTATGLPTATFTAGATIAATQAPASTPTPVPPTTAPTAAPTATPLTGAKSTTYRVQPGDSLQRIANIYGIEWELIAAANNITGSTVLQVGQELVIPGSGPLPTPTATLVRPPSATPMPSVTPMPLAPAPVLVLPEPDKYFHGDAIPPILKWETQSGLPPGAKYRITVRWTENGVPNEYYWDWTSIDVQMPAWLWLKADRPARLYTWFVTVVQINTDGKGGEVAIPLTYPSAPSTFHWD